MQKIALVLVSLFFFSCNNSAPTQQAPQQQTAPDSTPVNTASTPGAAPAEPEPSISLTDEDTLVQDKGAIYDAASHVPALTVTVIKSEDASAGDPDEMEAREKHFKYPPEYAFDNAGEAGKTIAAYGTIYSIWLGPKDWTGTGVLYTNGGITVDLFPQGEEDMHGAHVSFSLESGTPDAVFRRAAPFFARAKKQYDKIAKEQGGGAPAKLPAGTKVETVNAKTVSYTCPEEKGFVTCGIAHFDPGGKDDDPYFKEVVIKLPAGQEATGNLLMRGYMARLK